MSPVAKVLRALLPWLKAGVVGAAVGTVIGLIQVDLKRAGPGDPEGSEPNDPDEGGSNDPPEGDKRHE